MKKTLLSVIMLLPAAVFAQTITGKISQTGNVVPYVEVIAVKDQKKQTAISDENGNYSLRLSENGTYTIKLIQDGLEISNKELTVNGVVKHDFFLKKRLDKSKNKQNGEVRSNTVVYETRG